MSEFHDLPLEHDKLIKMLDRRCDLLYDRTLSHFRKVFTLIFTDVSPLMEEVKRSMESAADDARLENIPVESISSLPRLLALCKDVDALVTAYERIVKGRNTPAS
jgi:hypothetical protein